MAFAFTMKGDKELSRLLAALPPKLARKALSPALRSGSKKVLRAIRAGAPRFTGALAGGDWKVRARKLSRRKLKVAFKILSPTRASLAAGKSGSVEGLLANVKKFASDKYYYPAVLEYGSAHVAPNPFVRTATNASTAAVVGEVRQAVRGNIARLAKEAAAKGGD